MNYKCNTCINYPCGDELAYPGNCKDFEEVEGCTMGAEASGATVVSPAEVIPYQKCPKCNGQGYLIKPANVAGDQNEWSSSSANNVCDVCNGAKIIPMYRAEAVQNGIQMPTISQLFTEEEKQKMIKMSNTYPQTAWTQIVGETRKRIWDYLKL